MTHSLAIISLEEMLAHFVIGKNRPDIPYGKGSTGMFYEIFFHIQGIKIISWQLPMNIRHFFMSLRVMRFPSSKISMLL